ncbi:ribonuclease P protein component [Mycolicibacterium smegmatis]|uniref:ribonuclease P protein component n=1 Tax=Mycolicibacterium smegmatis TaxID=1772 RepID=UPI0005D859DA|nr:ribonuclease P protein component [Mycolicibacterium smegmatis]MCP2625668.1 ribonuclease P protein component [Mycolicibacterium smegmatis]MDF1897712.1 ribonuclease P protein component [Mycolicibacterium smegmatis]MDF1904268.1 ribonuclease P protein component [Mycolicibacterium smegmatis]MDF1917757.1 ribonuclease P protein component [Mycolicibacterium smegmatis]MDF1923114.1 ribonuclease P protein component [Mycolicibacterium smegmatis]
MLPARNRMRRSAEFSVTVSRGVRAAQPDVVVHALRLESNAGNAGDDGDANGPRIGLIVSKAVGNAVERHRVSRRLRHVAKTFVSGLDPADLIVIRARPSSRDATSSRLERQLGQALERVSSKRRASP